MDSGVSHADLATELAMFAGFVYLVATLLWRLFEEQRCPGATPSGATVLQASLRPIPSHLSRRSKWFQQEAEASPLTSSARDNASSLNNARRDPIIAPSHHRAFNASFAEGCGDVVVDERRNSSKDTRSYSATGLPLDADDSRIASMIRSAPSFYARDSQASKPARVSSGSRYFAELIRRQGGNIPVTPPGPITPLTTRTPLPLTLSKPNDPGPMLPGARLRAGSRLNECTQSNGTGPVLNPFLSAKFTK